MQWKGKSPCLCGWSNLVSFFHWAHWLNENGYLWPALQFQATVEVTLLRVTYWCVVKGGSDKATNLQLKSISYSSAFHGCTNLLLIMVFTGTARPIYYCIMLGVLFFFFNNSRGHYKAFINTTYNSVLLFRSVVTRCQTLAICIPVNTVQCRKKLI